MTLMHMINNTKLTNEQTNEMKTGEKKKYVSAVKAYVIEKCPSGFVDALVIHLTRC